MLDLQEAIRNIRISDLITLAVVALVLISLVRSGYFLYLRKKSKKPGFEFRKNLEANVGKSPGAFGPNVTLMDEITRPEGVFYRLHRRSRHS